MDLQFFLIYFYLGLTRAFCREIKRLNYSIFLQVPWIRNREPAENANLKWLYGRNSIALHSLSENEDAFNTYENCFYI